MSGTRVESSGSLYEKSLSLARQKQFDHALALLEPMLEKKDEIMEKAWILRAGLLIQKKDMETATQLCRQLIGANLRCAPAYLLLGMMAGMGHHPRESLKQYRESTHIEPNNWLAHFLMFQTYQALGNKDKASRQAAVVIRLLEKGQETHHGLDYFPFSFSRDDILKLCRKQPQLKV
jgi:tetratricopeptide (TPR) repeat protein